MGRAEPDRIASRPVIQAMEIVIGYDVLPPFNLGEVGQNRLARVRLSLAVAGSGNTYNDAIADDLGIGTQPTLSGPRRDPTIASFWRSAAWSVL